MYFHFAKYRIYLFGRRDLSNQRVATTSTLQPTAIAILASSTTRLIVRWRAERRRRRQLRCNQTVRGPPTNFPTVPRLAPSPPTGWSNRSHTLTHIISPALPQTHRRSLGANDPPLSRPIRPSRGPLPGTGLRCAEGPSLDAEQCEREGATAPFLACCAAAAAASSPVLYSRVPARSLLGLTLLALRFCSPRISRLLGPTYESTRRGL